MLYNETLDLFASIIKMFLYNTFFFTSVGKTRKNVMPFMNKAPLVDQGKIISIDKNYKKKIWHILARGSKMYAFDPSEYAGGMSIML